MFVLLIGIISFVLVIGAVIAFACMMKFVFCKKKRRVITRRQTSFSRASVSQVSQSEFTGFSDTDFTMENVNNMENSNIKMNPCFGLQFGDERYVDEAPSSMFV